MKFQFEPNLKFQIDAISSVASLFDGASYIKPENTVFNEVSGNVLNISHEQIFDNFDQIVKENDIVDPRKTDDLDFSIEMETGTGKTYVYLRTIIELYLKYGLSKYIIVVPSIAVKRGVLKSLELLKEHFLQLYNTYPNVIEYDSSKLSRVRNFCYDTNLSIMVMNTQSFNSDDNLINRDRDQNYGVKLIDLIRRIKPVIILDEPQEGMDSENMIERFKTLDPLFKLRYSATHRVVKNLVYRLTPYDAYNQNLVKKIEVLSIHETNTQSNVYIKFEDIKLFTTGAKPQAKLSVSFRQASGDFKVKSALFKDGDSLEEKTNNPVYNGWIVERVVKDPYTDITKVFFSNGVSLVKGHEHGFDKESIFREQIKRAIQSHLKRKKTLSARDIKPLTLFFIDRVKNYTDNDGLIRRLFEELYPLVYQEFHGSEPENISKVHNGYFAKTQAGEFTDSESSMQKNSEIFKLIMQDKERLLSFEEPLEFIFSHSALGVGWDNPNIFNICTLNESESYIKKRQEIGRGLRICVDQEGKRVRDDENTNEGEEINVLTVIANQSYYSFVSSYQQELADEYGTDAKKPPITDAQKPLKDIVLNKDTFNSDVFRSLWNNIAKKTKFDVYFREEEIVKQCIEALDSIHVAENVLNVELNRIVGIDEEYFKSQSAGSTVGTVESLHPDIDVIELLSSEAQISRSTAQAVMEGVSNYGEFVKNPMAYISQAVPLVKQVLDAEMVRLVKYDDISEVYDTSQFQEVMQTRRNAVSIRNGLYDKIIVDSDIEERFGLDLDNQNKVKLFLKLPEWYLIDTPIGKYNPDFALVIEKTDLDNKEEQEKYYFVVETKGSREWEDLRQDEKLKIECAVKHFEAIGLEEYLYPVDSLSTFNQKAQEKTGVSFFN